MYQILTDSECGLPAATLQEHHVEVIPFHFEVNGQTVASDLANDQLLEDLYAKVKAGIQPTTSAINVGEYIEFFKPYVLAQTPILFLGTSSALSSSYANAVQARQILLESHPQAEIHIVDTLAACAGEGRLVLEAIHLQADQTPLADVIDWIMDNRLRVQHWFTVDSLDFLYHGGRISKATATLGTLLHIKPLLNVNATGKLQMVSKIRTRKHALTALADHAKAALKLDATQPVLISTSGDWEAAQTVQDLIHADFPQVNCHIGPIGSTIACHTGFGCVAVFVTGPASERQDSNN